MLSRQFLSVKDVADLLKVGEVAVRSWIKHGDLRAVDVSREWRIAPRDLESFLQRHANRAPDSARPAEGEHGGADAQPSPETSPGNKE
jgi:excisionase family DNA binding protein